MQAGGTFAASFMSPAEMQATVANKKRPKSSPDDTSSVNSSGGGNSVRQEVVHVIQKNKTGVEDLKIILEMYLDLLKEEPDWRC